MSKILLGNNNKLIVSFAGSGFGMGNMAQYEFVNFWKLILMIMKDIFILINTYLLTQGKLLHKFAIITCVSKAKQVC